MTREQVTDVRQIEHGDELEIADGHDGSTTRYRVNRAFFLRSGQFILSGILDGQKVDRWIGFNDDFTPFYAIYRLEEVA